MGTETLRRRRGHNFFPPKADAKKIPAIGTTDGQGDAAIVHLHFFTASGDWYITEADFETGEAFGWADLGYGEWGYMNLVEMESVYVPPFGIIERDLDWTPQPLHAALVGRGR